MPVRVVVMAIAFLKTVLVIGPFLLNFWYVRAHGLHGGAAVVGWALCIVLAIGVVGLFRKSTGSSVLDDNFSS